MTNDQLATIRELASKARIRDLDKHDLSLNTVDFKLGGLLGVITVQVRCHPDDENDRDTRDALEAIARYIAALDPTTVLGMVAEAREHVEKLKAEIDRLVSLPQDVRTCGELSCEDCDARTVGLRAEVERLRGALGRCQDEGACNCACLSIAREALKEQPCKA